MAQSSQKLVFRIISRFRLIQSTISLFFRCFSFREVQCRNQRTLPPLFMLPKAAE